MIADSKRKYELCYTDCGGTFTDTFIVDSNGDFIVAKAPTTPADISEGFFNSIANASQMAGISMGELCSGITVMGFGSTVVINTVLTRKGVKVGAIVTRGFEQVLLMERAKQSWTEYNHQDGIHWKTHRHTKPLVPYTLTRGASERVNSLGQIVVPLYEDQVVEGARALLEQGVEAIVVCFLFSWQNPIHERRAGEIVAEVAQSMGRDVRVYLSVDVNPVLRELSRLQSTIIEAYTTPRFRESLGKMEAQLKTHGFRGDLQIMQSTGGLAPARLVKVVETLESGPVGGLIGGQYVGQVYGFDNVLTTDVGGTSFDVGLVRGGMFSINREPICARMILGIPMAELTSVGAGGGTIARIDPLTGRLGVGPDSAGADPGPVCYDKGGEHPTVTDADLVLGYISPGYFLGGRIQLNKEKATEALQRRIAGPLGLSAVEAAAGIKELIDVKMRDAILALVVGKGVEVRQYHLLAFGGGGPTHVAGYTGGIPFQGVMVFPYSAVFSAFGAAAADYEHRYIRATNIVVPPYARDEVKQDLGAKISRLWEMLEEEARSQMTREGFGEDQVRFKRLAMIRYARQLDDLIVTSPLPRINAAADWDVLIAAFENLYEQVFAKGAKYQQAGYEIFEVGLIATVPKIKPKLAKYALKGPTPPDEAQKGHRPSWFNGDWTETGVFEWDLLQPGNMVEGPAIVENRTTTLVVPPGMRADVDQYLTVWLRGASGKSMSEP